jgi:hypothetical protein
MKRWVLSRSAGGLLIIVALMDSYSMHLLWRDLFNGREIPPLIEINLQSRQGRD